MKNKYINLREQLEKASKRFEEIMRKPKDETVRDSAIQRFEFTFELAWKTLKAFLEEKGYQNLYAPRDVIKESFRYGLINEDERWLDMIKTRNKTSHMYNEAMVDQVYDELPQYVDLIKSLIEKLT